MTSILPQQQFNSFSDIHDFTVKENKNVHEKSKSLYYSENDMKSFFKYYKLILVHKHFELDSSEVLVSKPTKYGMSVSPKQFKKTHIPYMWKLHEKKWKPFQFFDTTDENDSRVIQFKKIQKESLQLEKILQKLGELTEENELSNEVGIGLNLDSIFFDNDDSNLVLLEETFERFQTWRVRDFDSLPKENLYETAWIFTIEKEAIIKHGCRDFCVKTATGHDDRHAYVGY